MFKTRRTRPDSVGTIAVTEESNHISEAHSQKLIALETRRYSAMLRRILVTYRAGATIRIDGKKFGENDVPDLLDDWCKNARIIRTRTFILERQGRSLFGFHDHPSETWAALTELPFAETLRKEGVARYRILPVRRSLLTNVLRRLRKWVSIREEND